MSVWRVDAINPIETFNLPPADKNRGSLGGGGKRRGLSFLTSRVSAAAAESPLDFRGKQHLGVPSLQFGSIDLPQQRGFISSRMVMSLFLLFMFFYVTTDSIVNTWVKVKINSHYIPVQVTHFKLLPVIKPFTKMDCK